TRTSRMGSSCCTWPTGTATRHRRLLPARADPRGSLKVRRAAELWFSCGDGRTLDIGELLSGRLATAPQTRVYAISPATGTEQRISRDELDVLFAVPADDWTESDAYALDLVRGLVERGLLIADGGEALDERLRTSGWERHAAVYHFMTRWRDVDIRDGAGDVVPATEEHVPEFLELNGPPPPAFCSVDAPARVVDLPEVPTESDLYSVLARRRTTRGFDESRPLPLEELALVLHQVFGVHGHATTADGVWETLK